MADIIYNRGKFLLLQAALAGVTLDMRAAIITGTAAGVDDVDLNTVSEVDAVSGVSIHAERVALTGEAASEDDVNNRAAVDAANATFAASVGTTARAMIVYHEGTGADSGRELIFCYTTNFPSVMDGGLVVTINDLARAS
jgi:hypothetical protein